MVIVLFMIHCRCCQQRNKIIEMNYLINLHPFYSTHVILTTTASALFCILITPTRILLGNVSYLYFKRNIQQSTEHFHLGIPRNHTVDLPKIEFISFYPELVLFLDFFYHGDWDHYLPNQAQYLRDTYDPSFYLNS